MSIRLNLPESSADWFKLTNENLNIKGNIILCETPVLQKLHVVDDTPSPPSGIRKERCPGYEVSFMTNIS